MVATVLMCIQLAYVKSIHTYTTCVLNQPSPVLWAYIPSSSPFHKGPPLVLPVCFPRPLLLLLVLLLHPVGSLGAVLRCYSPLGWAGPSTGLHSCTRPSDREQHQTKSRSNGTTVDKRVDFHLCACLHYHLLLFFKGWKDIQSCSSCTNSRRGCHGNMYHFGPCLLSSADSRMLQLHAVQVIVMWLSCDFALAAYTSGSSHVGRWRCDAFAGLLPVWLSR